MNKMVITGITILQNNDTILLHGVRVHTNGNLPLGLTIEANIKDYPYYYACMETATPIVIDKDKEQFILFIFFVVNKYSQDYRHKSVSV